MLLKLFPVCCPECLKPPVKPELPESPGGFLSCRLRLKPAFNGKSNVYRESMQVKCKKMMKMLGAEMWKMMSGDGKSPGHTAVGATVCPGDYFVRIGKMQDFQGAFAFKGAECDGTLCFLRLLFRAFLGVFYKLA